MNARVPALLVVGVLALLSASVRAQDPVVGVDVDPLPAQVGLVMEVVVSVSGDVAADSQIVATPDVDGARLRLRGGPQLSNSFVSINGRQRQSTEVRWSFELVPERAGELVLPPFVLNCRGAEVRSAPKRIDVVPSTGVLAEDIVRLDVIPSVDDLYVGQTVTFEVEGSVRDDVFDYIPRGGLLLELPWLDGTPGLHLLELPTPSCARVIMPANDGRHELPTCVAREVSGGYEWIVYKWSIPMLATRSGTTRVDGSHFSARFVTGTTQQPNQISIFGRRTQATRIVEVGATSEGPRLAIHPTPEAGRPPTYTNAVGHFTFSAEVEPRAVKVGESCRLSLVVSLADPNDASSGNIATLEWPAFDSLERDFRIFGKEEKNLGHSRLLEFELSPKTSLVSEVPQLALAVFDPTSAAYETLTVGPFGLSVAAGGQDGLTTALATDEELLNDMETIRESLPAPRDGGLPPFTWWLLGAVVLGVVETRRQVSGWRTSNPAAVARRGARRALEHDLRAIDGAAALAAAFARYLARRLGGPDAGLTAEDAAQRIPDAELSVELRSVVGRWEAAYLGGAPLDLEQAKGEARSLADRLEALP